VKKASNQKFLAKINIYPSSALKNLNNITFDYQTDSLWKEF